MRRVILLLATSLSLGALFIGPAHAVAPTVLYVSAANPDGVYGANDTITILVKFSQNVIVTGSPTLRVVPTVNATYDSGSGTDTLSFLYTIPTNTISNELDYAYTYSLDGTIKNAGGQSANLTLAAPGTNGSLASTKNILFEHFDDYRYTSFTMPNVQSFVNLVYSTKRNSLLTAGSGKILELNLAMDTYTVLLDTGGIVNNLQIYGNFFYWTNSNTLYRSSLTNPSVETFYINSTSIASFTRTPANWILLDTTRKLYRVTVDSSHTRTLVTTLSSSVMDLTDLSGQLFTSLSADKVILIAGFQPTSFEINTLTGVATTRADLSKCMTTSVRGMVRLTDDSEIYSNYGLSSFGRLWPDGHVTCASTSAHPSSAGAMTIDDNYIYLSVLQASLGDHRIARYTPVMPIWPGPNYYDPSILTTTISTPSLSGGAFSAAKGIPVSISARASMSGKVTFYSNDKRIGGCINVPTVSFVATCNWKPSIQGVARVTATFTPSATEYTPSTSPILMAKVIRRTTTR